MSVENLGWVIRHSPYKGVKFNIHMCLADLANSAHGDEVWMRHEKVAAMSRTTRSTVTKFFTELIEDGFMELVEDNSKNGRNDASRYRLVCNSDAAVVYDRTTKSGRPGDSEPEIARKASDFRKSPQTREAEALRAAGAPTLFGDPVAPGRRDPDADVSDDDGPLAPVLTMNPPGDSTRDYTAEELLEQLAESPIDPSDSKALSEASRAVLGYYNMWRKEQNMGRMTNKSWNDELVKIARNVMVDLGLSPRIVAGIVMDWHDKNMERHRHEEAPYAPGLVKTLAQSLMDRSNGAPMHGIDAKGTSARQAATNTRLSALADPSRYADYI